MNPRQICEESTTKFITVTGLGIALTFALTLIGFPFPMAGEGGYFHFGHIPHLLFAMVFGRKIGALTGGIGMLLSDLLTGYALWAPVTFVVSGLMGYLAGAMGEKKSGLPWQGLAMAATIPIKVLGYYLFEGFLIRNWIVPLASIPSNIIQVALAAVVVLPLITPMKKVAMGILS